MERKKKKWALTDSLLQHLCSIGFCWVCCASACSMPVWKCCVVMYVCVCVCVFPEKDIRQQAVDEMMQRIKKGVNLKPVRQTPNRARPLQVHTHTHTHTDAWLAKVARA